MKTTVIVGITVLFVLAVCAPVQAYVIAKDEFLTGAGEHTAGLPVPGQSCGVGWADAWAAGPEGDDGWISDATGLVSPCGAGAGGAARLASGVLGDGNTSIRRYAGTHNNPDTYWVSQMLSAAGTSEQLDEARLFATWWWTDGETTDKALRFTLRYGDVMVAFPGYTDRHLLREGYTSGEVLHFIAKIEVDYQDTTADRVTVMLNPTDCSSEANALNTAAATYSEDADLVAEGYYLNYLHAQALKFNFEGMTAAVDGIVIGSRFADLFDGGTEPIPGDANDDGIVNDQDASILAAHWQQTGMGWGDGDFNNDQVVNDQDASILAAHWQETGEGAAPVPEPTMTLLLALALVSLWGCRLGRGFATAAQ